MKLNNYSLEELDALYNQIALLREKRQLERELRDEFSAVVWKLLDAKIPFYFEDKNGKRIEVEEIWNLELKVE